MVHVVFNDRWWLCNDTTVKAMNPPPDPRKATFLLYKRKQTDLVVPDMSQRASQRTGPPAPGQTRDARSVPTDTSVPAMALAPGESPPTPPSTQGASRVGYIRNRLYACPERAYGRLCASHGAGTRRTPPFPNCNTECFKGSGHEYACPEHAQ